MGVPNANTCTTSTWNRAFEAVLSKYKEVFGIGFMLNIFVSVKYRQDEKKTKEEIYKDKDRKRKREKYVKVISCYCIKCSNFIE